ncbi:hypothetical protein EDB89DRAFT_1080119 [Lactarius sanguifluus]|nr:hypothetical protein EDB89DRAFT_1080119 [Lactarius sanguifluus]
MRSPFHDVTDRACPPTHTTRIQYTIGVLFLFFGVGPTPVTVTTVQNSGVFTALPSLRSCSYPLCSFSSPLLAPYFYLTLPSFFATGRWKFQVRLNAASRVPRSRGLRWAGSVLSTSHRQAAPFWVQLRRASVATPHVRSPVLLSALCGNEPR